MPPGWSPRARKLARALIVGTSVLIGTAAGVSLWFAITLSVDVREFTERLRRSQVTSCQRVNVVREALDFSLSEAVVLRKRAGGDPTPFLREQIRLRSVPFALPDSGRIDCERAIPRHP